ncbi:MAG: TrmH family RNA methyltransferase [Myxococcota bacterium]
MRDALQAATVGAGAGRKGSAGGATSARRRLVGAEAIAEALERGAELRVVLCGRGLLAPEDEAVVARARARGIAVRATSDRERLRLTDGAAPAALLALEGPSVDPGLEELMARAGLVVVLVGLRYPGNVGFIVRAAEVAGAAGVVLCEAWTRAERASAMRFAMQADRFFPVVDADAEAAAEAARRAGRRLFALETGGTRTPWEAPLDDPLAIFLGGEAEGIPAAILARMDEVLRIPMRGFIPSYNVQAAAGIVLGEWLRRRHDPGT